MRVLPWLEEARGKVGNHDCLVCERCMQQTEHQARRVMRCGYLPESELLEGQRFLPDSMSRDDVQTCPGYTTSLPEVVEVIGLYHAFESGQLRDACGGRRPPRLLFDALSLLKGAVLSKEAYRMREKNQAGGSNGPG